MKRGKAGMVILAGLLALCIGATVAMGRRHEPIARILSAASDLAAAGEWEEAKTLAGKARADWEKRWHFTAVFADHTPMEEIDGLFARLKVYEKQDDRAAFAVVCAELSVKIAAMGDAHTPNWWNLL